MWVLVINLDRETARMAFQREQAAQMGFEIERIGAVMPDAVAPPADDAFWQRWQRPLRDVEKAAFLSHRAAWQQVAASASPVLVLEDDAWLMPQTPRLLAQAAQLAGIDLLTLETRGRKKLLGPAHPEMAAIRRLWLDRSGAAAYLLWPAGARKLMRRADRVPGLADAVIGEARLRRWQADPAMALQFDMAARHGLTPPIAVQSAISTVARPARVGTRFRVRRIWRQAVMLALRLRHPLAERREAPIAKPKPADPPF